MVSFKLVDRGLGFISTLVLARLLVPADFGLVAMAMILIGALQLLISFSFDVPLIQNPNAGRDQFDTAWTFNALFATVCGVALAALAIPAAHFYREPRLEAVIYLLAVGFALQGFSNIGPVIFRREMRFDREFKFLLGKRMASLCVTIPLAFYLRNYWALVIGQLAGTVVSVLLSYMVSDYRPSFSLKAKVELFHSSKWLMINNIVHFLNGRSAEFILGRLSGPQALGVYTISSEISTLPTTELVAPINRAAFPGYAKAATDIAQLGKSFLNVISMIALFALPAGIGIVSIADLMIPVVLGDKWLEAIPLIQILAICGVIQAVQTNIGYVYMAVGSPKLITLIAGLQLLVLLALLIPGIYYGAAIGAAWAFLACAVIMIPVNQILVARRLDLSGTDFILKILRPLIASLAMSAVIWILKTNLGVPETALAHLWMLVACVAAGAAVYAFSIYGLWVLASRPEGAERISFLQIEHGLRKLGIRISLVGS